MNIGWSGFSSGLILGSVQGEYLVKLRVNIGDSVQGEYWVQYRVNIGWSGFITK